MNGPRLKVLRLARGLTLDQLAGKMGGIVTKQAISKYELGLAKPSPRVLVALAGALNVKAISLAAEPAAQARVVAFRKLAGLSKAKEEQLRSQMLVELQQRVALQDRVALTCPDSLPVGRYSIRGVEDAEEAAEALRRDWHLGLDPIASVTDTLEDHCVHVIDVEAPEALDGMSALASLGDQPVAAAVASRHGVPGERQRLNLTHELGHLFMVMPDGIDQEKAAFRFGAALLAPRQVLFDEIGSKRTDVREEELFILKKRFGLSLQALVYRMHDLEIIGTGHYQDWWKYINSKGWKKSEPEELDPEQPSWLRRSALRALSEGLISSSEAETLLGCPLEPAGPVPRRKSMAHLSPATRRELLEKQARHAAEYYSSEADASDDEVVEY
jgi:transcriptional regulator with XRE-family HTH domain